ncbi:MAG: tetratricopeptide (TPR) repeat protein [Limisphaerales bacterium]|jgi:tetratricopeptide (TPR) repeat protein
MLFLVVFTITLASCGSTKSATGLTNLEDEGVGTVTDQSKVERMFINGVRARSLGDIDAAIEIFINVLKEDSQNDAANFELARIYMEAGELITALTYAERAKDLDPTNEFYLIQHADLLMVSGKLDESALAYQELVELTPDDMTPYFQLAFIYQQLDELQEALSIYESIEQQFGAEPSLLLEIHRIYMVEGKLDKAAETMERLIEMIPDDPEYYRMLARIYEADNDKEKVIEVYERMILQQGDNPALKLQIANIYKMKGDFSKFNSQIRDAFTSEFVDIDDKIGFLVPYIDSVGNKFASHDLVFELTGLLVETHNTDPKAHAMTGDFLYYEGRKKDARASYLKSLSQEKSIYDVWRQVITIDLETNAHDSLVALTSRAIEMFPNQPANYYFNGYGNMQTKRYEEAVSALEQALPMTIQNQRLRADIYSALGDAYHNLKDHERSDEAYDNCLGITPNNAFVLNNYSYYLSLRDASLEKAAEMAARANQITPETSSFEDTYAWVLYKLARFEEARKWQERALNHGGKDSPIQLDHYGDILFQLGETENAVEYWKKARDNGMDSGVIDRKIADRKLYE